MGAVFPSTFLRGHQMSTNQTENAQAQPSTGGSSTDAPPHAKNEAALWVHFYERVGDPIVASILVAKLEGDPIEGRAHAALHMRAEETLRRYEMRVEHFHAVGRFVGSITRQVTALFSRAYRSIAEEVTATKHAMGAAPSPDNGPPVSLEAFCDLLAGDPQVVESLHRLFRQRPMLIAQHPALYAKVVAAVNAQKFATSSRTAGGSAAPR
jgi:hypothetical protein